MSLAVVDNRRRLVEVLLLKFLVDGVLVTEDEVNLEMESNVTIKSEKCTKWMRHCLNRTWRDLVIWSTFVGSKHDGVRGIIIK